MDRRKFLRSGSLAGFTVPALLTAKAGESAWLPSNLAAKDNDLTEATIDELQAKMQSGVLSSKAITKWYLKRIEQVDKKGPRLNSVIEVNPDAVTIAETMDAERKSGKVRGPMHGIPVLIKDNIDTGDKMMTTAGSLALVGNRATKDAFIVKQLREAGAVILGKTNLSEFANFRSSRSTSAWSSRGGQTKNPYILNRNPSGSSAGSGVAPAASLCAVAIGTETNGSIVSPASSNGVVGFKPTVGLWSRSGIIPISATQDTAGPMTRTVKDAAILLSALAGVDEADNVTRQSVGKVQKDYTKFLDSDALKGKRIGVESSLLKGTAKPVALFNKAISVLKEKGATIVEVELLKLTRPLGEASYEVLQFEFKDGLNKYLATANARVKSLKQIIEYNDKNEPVAMPFFKQETLISSEAKAGLDSKEYTDALAKSTSSRKIIDDLFQQYKLDAVCGITSGPAGCIDIINGDYGTGFSFSSPAAMAGYPHITVPMGYVHELPVGISIFGTAYSEDKILGIAYAYEQATKARQSPKFLPSIG
ncbi:MAG: amidase [Segetibacter sp.]|nr:amidase [Segetibacter sp.]